MSESVPAVMFTKMPVTVLAAAINPISKSLALRYSENHVKVGDLDIVELKIAKAPIRHNNRKPLGSFSPSSMILHVHCNSQSQLGHHNYFIYTHTILNRIKMKWVTREHVHVDRVACPWLIKRFIDPNAEFKFIPWPGTELKPEDGIPFDIPGVELGHHDNKCSFEAIIEKYNLKDDPALLELAKIVHAADISADRDKAPEAAGLEAIASGAMYIVNDDYEALEKEFFIYDALYAYCQLKLLREQYKEQLEKMSRKERYEFLKSKIRKIG